MVDKITFMETLRSVAEITKTSNEPLSREEINKYFENMDLSIEQKEMVYQYLSTPQEDPVEEKLEESVESGEESDGIKEAAESIETAPTEKELSDSEFFKMYLEDIAQLPQLSEEEIQTLYDQVLQGDESVVQAISDYWLPRVVEIAKNYIGQDVNMEDVVQEGNIGLLFGITSVIGNKEAIEMEGYLEQSIKEAMTAYIDEMINEEDWGSTIIAKVTLVHEAQKALQEELNRMPTVDELCRYTNVSVEEINDILELIKESIK